MPDRQKIPDRQKLKDLASQTLQEKQQEYGFPDWWKAPLVATAKADARFEQLPAMAAKNHMLPRDLLASCQSVICFFVPFCEELVTGNAQGKFASRQWGQALTWTNTLITDIAESLAAFFSQQGFLSELTPATYNFDPNSLTARWSHKHLATLCHLGRFGVNAQLITPQGCAGRLGSLVTEMPVQEEAPVQKKELCLHKAGKRCLACQKSCPVGAVQDTGIDRHTCNARLQVNLKRIAAMPGMPDDAEVCAKCVAGMPCAMSSPVPPC